MFPLSVYILIHTHPSVSTVLTISVTLVPPIPPPPPPFCMSPRQPALVWLHTIKKKKKKKHYTLMKSSYLKQVFGSMMWLCMYRSSFLTFVFSLCSSPQRSSFRTPSCELKGSSRCECVCEGWISAQSRGKTIKKREKGPSGVILTFISHSVHLLLLHCPQDESLTHSQKVTCGHTSLAKQDLYINPVWREVRQ